MKGIFEAKLKKKDGKLKYTKESYNILYKEFIDLVKNNDEVSMIMEIETGDGPSLAQLAKVHKCIRVLASDLGYNFEDVKILIKDKAGLVIKRTVEGKNYMDWKSFGKCSAEEINLAIQACIAIGDMVGSNLR